MANPNLTDMTEEDAADLQFPKGMFFFRGNKKIKKNKIYLFLTYNQMMMFVIVFFFDKNLHLIT